MVVNVAGLQSSTSAAHRTERMPGLRSEAQRRAQPHFVVSLAGVTCLPGALESEHRIGAQLPAGVPSRRCSSACSRARRMPRTFPPPSSDRRTSPFTSAHSCSDGRSSYTAKCASSFLPTSRSSPAMIPNGISKGFTGVHPWVRQRTLRRSWTIAAVASMNFSAAGVRRHAPPLAHSRPRLRSAHR